MGVRKQLILAVVLVLGAVLAGAALADHGGSDENGKGLQTRLVGSILSDPAIHGVTRGSVPWAGGGVASLERSGRFEVSIEGLVVAGTNGTDGVRSIRVSLFCAPNSGTTPAFTTRAVRLSSEGEARVRKDVALPARCLAPVVLVHPNGNLARYIAASAI